LTGAKAVAGIPQSAASHRGDPDALGQVGTELLASDPDIRRVEILAVK
jgi:hypothetical protein